MFTENHSTMKLQAATVAVKEHIDHYPLDRKNASTFAKEMQIKREELQKCFNEKYSKRISEYQQERLMEFACILLAGQEKSIKEIALICGYSNQNNFTNAFKKHQKMTPTEWQTKHTNESTEAD